MSKNGTGLVLGGVVVLGIIAYTSFNTSKKGVEALRFALSNVRFGAIKILTTKLNISVRAENPSQQNLEYDNVDFALDLIYNGSIISKIRQVITVKVDAGGSVIVPLEVEINNVGAAAALFKSISSGVANAINIKGTIKYVGISVPVNITKQLLP